MTNEIKHTRGDTLILNGVVKSDGVASDITGCSFIFTLRKGVDKADYPAVLQKTGVITDAPTGKYKIEASSSEMNLDLETYVYDIQMTDSLGVITTISIGKFIIDYDIT